MLAFRVHRTESKHPEEKELAGVGVKSRSLGDVFTIREDKTWEYTSCRMERKRIQTKLWVGPSDPVPGQKSSRRLVMAAVSQISF